jgi:hypothetical protein
VLDVELDALQDRANAVVIVLLLEIGPWKEDPPWITNVLEQVRKVVRE